MVRLAVLVAVLLLFGSAHVADARSDAEQHGLKGPVKRVVTERADFSDQEGLWTQGPEIGVSTQVYDEEGWVIESHHYDPRSSVTSDTTTTRQPDGSTISKTRAFEKDGALVSSSIITYDENRRRTKASAFNADGSVDWTERAFQNALGETVEERVAGDGSLLDRTVWFESPDGSRVAETTSYKDGLFRSRSRQVYDTQGRSMSSDRYDKDGRWASRLLWEYREDGQVDSETSYDAQGRLNSRRTYVYDDEGHKAGATELTYQSNGRPPSKTFFTYGPNNLTTSMTHTDASGLMGGIRTRYEFDDYGNWTRQTTSHCVAGRDQFGAPWQDPKPCEVTMRTITYYEDAEDVANSADTPPSGGVSQVAEAEGSVGGGTLSGKVMFEGVPPPPIKFTFRKFPKPDFCEKFDSDGHGNRVVQQVNVNEDHSLQDVVIAVQNVPMEKPFDFKETKVHADGCRWLVQGGPSTLVGVVVKKRDIVITNMDADPSDPKAATGVLHHPHAYEVSAASRSTLFNLPLPEKGQSVRKPVILRKKDSILFIEGDSNNYMQAYFLPVENPYYAIVDRDGAFAIRDIPPGTYTVLAWHPILGKQEASVTIPTNGEVKADFAFKME